jgi:hypothetical protein
MVWPIIVSVSLLVVFFESIDRVVSNESVVTNANLGSTCS